MKVLLTITALFLIFLSCYQYKSRFIPEKKPYPIYVSIPNIKDFRQDTITTSGNIIKSRISRENSTVSNAVAFAIRAYLSKKGITGDYKITRETLYRIVNSIPRRYFKSRNINKVNAGEVFSFRMPKHIIINRNGLFGYYKNVQRSYGREKLNEVLSIKWLKQYEENIFDCSEMSAFLEYWLENKGFNTDIVTNADHSWIIVETERGNWVHVESTSSQPYIIDERPYIRRFKEIFQAINISPTEYDWWKSIREGENIIGRN